MNGGDAILSRIHADCDDAVKAIEQDTQEKIGALSKNAEEQAMAAEKQIQSAADKKLAQLKSTAKSRAELEGANALLKRRRLEIDKTVEALHAYLTGLDDNSYFEAIYRLAAKLRGKSGTICLNSRDLSRLPSDFLQKLGSAGLNAQISDKPENITGGFILKSGGIEENMSFEALIADKRDALEDLIHRQLFV